ncbi:MAG: primosomal protein N' family DNA-binding protein [Minisyncoccota bacterium]
MNILEVIPISKAISKETLTYFSSLHIPLGSVVHIPLRSKKIHGIVVSSRPVSEKKGEIKNLLYNIKKIDAVHEKTFLLPSFIESAQMIADYTASSTGAVLSSLVPKLLIESIRSLEEPKVREKQNQSQVLVLQASDEERYAMYKSYIREEFAKNGSVFFILPTIEDIKTAKQTLEKGIEKYTHIFHTELPKKEIIESWNAAITSTHPIVVICTGSFLCLPRHDLGTIIVENESSRGYTGHIRPYMDIRKVAELVAHTYGIKLILGDMALRIETIWKQKNDIYAELSTLKFRSLSTSESALIDTRRPKNSPHKKFEILTPALKELIRQNKENNELLFLFCGRKGLAPISVCHDCGQTVTCHECGAPVTTYSKRTASEGATQMFVCHKCGTKRSAHETCTRCQSWNLQTLGIGIETTEKELKNLFPDIDVFVMDKSRIKTHKQAVALIDKFYDHPGSILLGTEMALTYITRKIDNAGVVSLDAFFALPDFRINEKIMHILLALRNLAEHAFIIQTRQPEQNVFDYALKGNLSDFYREEISLRKKLNYPPFQTFIKISKEGKKVEARKAMEEAKKFLAPYEVSLFESFHKGTNENYTVHALIILDRRDWVDKVLLSKLRALPPDFQIKIDPDSLL